MLLGLEFGGVACTSVLGIDGTYELGSTGGGAPGTGAHAGANSGGSVNSGGASGATGGDIAIGGTDGGTGCGTGPACASTMKCCLDTCVEPAPLVGCDLSGCAACPPPPLNGIAVCNGTACAIQCNNGYVENAGACDPLNTGGASGNGGTSSTGGTTTTCDAANCPGCSVIGPLGCCRNNNTCGCSYPGAPCY